MRFIESTIKTLKKDLFFKQASCLLLIGVCCGTVNAIGLGQLTSSITIGESYSGEVSLLDNDFDISELAVRRVFASEAHTLGISVLSTDYPLQMGFIERDSEIVVNIISNKPLKDPYLEFALELQWPTGRIVRHYTVLPDNPTAMPSKLEKISGGFEVAEDKSKALGNVTDKFSASNTEIISLTEYPNPAVKKEAVDYIVQSGDLVSFIARNWGRSIGRSSRALTHDTSQWIINNNPQAFAGGGAHTLIVGSKITLPTLNLINARGRLKSTEPTFKTQPIKSNGRLGQLVLHSNSKRKSIAAALELPNDADLHTQVTSLTLAIDLAKDEIARLSRENSNYREWLASVDGNRVEALLENILVLQEQQLSRLRTSPMGQGRSVINETEPLDGVGLLVPNNSAILDLAGGEINKSKPTDKNHYWLFKNSYIALIISGSLLWLTLWYFWLKRNSTRSVTTRVAPSTDGHSRHLDIEPLETCDEKSLKSTVAADIQSKSNEDRLTTKTHSTIDARCTNAPIENVKSGSVTSTVEEKLIPFERDAREMSAEDNDRHLSELTSLDNSNFDELNTHYDWAKEIESSLDGDSFELDLDESLASVTNLKHARRDDLTVEDKKLFGFTLDEDALKEFDDKDLMEFLVSEAESDAPENTAQFEDLPIYELDLINHNLDIDEVTQTMSILLKEVEFYLDMQQIEMARRLITQLSEEYDSPEIEALKKRCEKNAHH